MMPSGATGSVNEEAYLDIINDPEQNSNWKPKIVVIMGATGSGKSKLAIDLASHFPIEIINADSMQVYRGLDVLTNKVPLQDQKGVPHHLLGTISPSVEFTAKDFRDMAVPLIHEIWARHRVPVIVGGTNYYIQALVSPFLLEDSMEEHEENCENDIFGDKEHTYVDVEHGVETEHTYAHLKELDPVAANRVHPNDQRKISQYLSLYARFGVIPSSLLKEKTLENWGRVDESKYDCCFICVDVSLSVIDNFVEKRVDSMVDSGLLEEVFDIYTLNAADFTKGILQAIGVREFTNFFRSYGHENPSGGESFGSVTKRKKEHLRKILDSSSYEDEQKTLLMESIEKVKLNTRRLVRRQKRRIKRLQMLFGWNIHYMDATESLFCLSEDIWNTQVVDPCYKIIRYFLDQRNCGKKLNSDYEHTELVERNLWTRYICEACGNKVLRGTHEWEEHRQGRHHRKRISRLKKTRGRVSEDPRLIDSPVLY